MRGSIWRAALLAGVALSGLSACGEEAKHAAPAVAPAGPRLVLQAADTVGWQDVSAEIATVDQAQVVARIPGIRVTPPQTSAATTRQSARTTPPIDVMKGPVIAATMR